MQNFRILNIFLALMIISSPSYAELWVKHSSGTIESRYSGDCFKAGFCGKNNSNLDPAWIQVDQTEYNNASSKYYKVSGGAVVEMTQAERDAIDQAEADAQLAAKIAMADNLEYSTNDVIIALVKRLNTRLVANPITKAEIVQQLKDDKGL